MKSQSKRIELEKMLIEYGDKQFECGVCDLQNVPISEYSKLLKEAKQLKEKIIDHWRES